MEFIQIAGVVFALFAISRGYLKFRKKRLSLQGYLAWSILWLAVIVIAVLPSSTGFLAGWLGIGRGIDVVVYLSIILLYYLIFRVYLKMEELRKDITTLVREIAYKSAKKKRK